MAADISSALKNSESNSQAIVSVSSSITQQKVELQSELARIKSFFSDDIDQKIKSIPQPVIPSIEDAKKQFQAQIEPIYLDASNAKLRSSNNETKILILEKKVEQLQLLVNKLQLQG